jgi:hypothetical protein
MNIDYHITAARAQCRPRKGVNSRRRVVPLVSAHSGPRFRIPVTIAPARPVLVGDPDALRKMRAAEMAAWDARLPNTQATPVSAKVVIDNPEEMVPPASRTLRFWLLLLLLVCSTVAVSLDVQDFSLMAAGWSQLLAGLRSLMG